MSTDTDTMSENAKIEDGSNADPKAQGDPSGESVLGVTPCSTVDAELVLQFIDDLRGTFDGWQYDGGGGSSGYDMALTHLEGKIREHQRTREMSKPETTIETPQLRTGTERSDVALLRLVILF